jgi:hypothetical protein
VPADATVKVAVWPARTKAFCGEEIMKGGKTTVIVAVVLSV